MTIDAKELRQLAQAVQGSPRNIHERANAIHNLHDALPSGVVLEILDRLEAVEKERDDVAQRLADSERELSRFRKAWRTQCENIVSIAQDKRTLIGERDALRARVEEMERRLEPVAWLHETRGDYDFVADAVKHVWEKSVVRALSARPGAKGE